MSNLKTLFDDIGITLNKIEALANERSQRTAIEELIKTFSLRSQTAPIQRHGNLFIMSPEGANADVLCSVLKCETEGVPVKNAISNLRKMLQRADQLNAWCLACSSAPVDAITGPYAHVNNVFAFDRHVVKAGYFLIKSPALDYAYSVSHQLMYQDKSYCGIKTEAMIINNEYDGGPIYEMFDAIASTIIKYSEVAFHPNISSEQERLFQLTLGKGEPLLPDLYRQFVIAGLAYESPYWDYISCVGEIDAMDEEIVPLWHKHIASIIRTN